MNAIMQQYLPEHINYLQDDWADWLPLAEFAANNQASETTSASPFFDHKCFDTRCQFDLTPAAGNDVNDHCTLTTSRTLSKIHSHLYAEIKRANCQYQDNVDQYRLPSLNYQPRDLVWLNVQNWAIHCPSCKLNNKQHGPFKVLAKVLPYAYRIELPATIICHNVHYVLLLESVANNLYLG
jgi:hypothetical protein